MSGGFPGQMNAFMTPEGGGEPPELPPVPPWLESACRRTASAPLVSGDTIGDDLVLGFRYDKHRHTEEARGQSALPGFDELILRDTAGSIRFRPHGRVAMARRDAMRPVERLWRGAGG